MQATAYTYDPDSRSGQVLLETHGPADRALESSAAVHIPSAGEVYAHDDFVYWGFTPAGLDAMARHAGFEGFELIDAPVRFSRPSIDVTFTSAADHCGACATGVVLTGANDDGAAGLRRIVDRGGRGIVQDPRGAEMPVMPAAARLLVPEADVLALETV